MGYVTYKKLVLLQERAITHLIYEKAYEECFLEWRKWVGYKNRNLTSFGHRLIIILGRILSLPDNFRISYILKMVCIFYILFKVHFKIYCIFTYVRLLSWRWTRRCPRGVMVIARDCGIVVREFVLQSCYYVHFRANTIGKGMNPLSSQLWVK